MNFFKCPGTFFAECIFEIFHTGLAPPKSGEDRPITPQKEIIDLNDPNIIDATPPGLAPARKKPQSKKTSNNNQSAASKQPKNPTRTGGGQGSGKTVEEVVGNEIPEDADAAETFYSQQDDFESDSENDVSAFKFNNEWFYE